MICSARCANEQEKKTPFSSLFTLNYLSPIAYVCHLASGCVRSTRNRCCCRCRCCCPFLHHTHVAALTAQTRREASRFHSIEAERSLGARCLLAAVRACSRRTHRHHRFGQRDLCERASVRAFGPLLARARANACNQSAHASRIVAVVAITVVVVVVVVGFGTGQMRACANFRCLLDRRRQRRQRRSFCDILTLEHVFVRLSLCIVSQIIVHARSKSCVALTNVRLRDIVCELQRAQPMPVPHLGLNWLLLPEYRSCYCCIRRI